MRKPLITIFLSLSVPQLLYAAELAIPNSPLFSASEPPANVIFLMDNSGSMDYEVIAKPHYEKCNYDPDQSYFNCSTGLRDDGYFYFSERNRYFFFGNYFISRPIYYFFNINNAYSNFSTKDFPEMVDEDWRIFDSDFNGMAYNPGTQYIPWIGPCRGSGTTRQPYIACENANFQSARSHPHENNPAYNARVNLGNDGNYLHSYVISIDNKRFTGNAPNRNNIANGSNGMIEPWDSHMLIQFTGNTQIRGTLRATNNAAVQSTVSSRTFSGSTCFDALGPKSLVKEIIAGTRSINATNGPGCRTVAQAQQNYANWYEFYRRRAYTAKASVGYVVSKFPSLYYGFKNINDSGITRALPGAVADLTNSNNNLLNNYFGERQLPIGTPLISALDSVGQYYSQRTNSPIISSCQRNFSILFTDGFWNDTALERPLRGDIDRDGYGTPYSTLSDIAAYYYKNDLRPDLVNNVAPTEKNPATYQHMVTLGVGFGVSATLKDTDGDGWPNPPLRENSDWGNPDCGTECPAKIDDLWHAAFNSKGMYVSAGNFEDLELGLSAGLESIVSEMQGSLSSVASNSSILIDNSAIYQAQFKAGEWSGNLIAYPISPLGVINMDAPKWRAAAQLKNKSPNNRVILTYGSKRGVPFRWPSNYQSPKSNEITNTQINLFLNGISSNQNSTGQTMLDYIRGDRSFEATLGGPYRTRATVLGDIVHSSAIYVPPPSSRFTDQFYARFKSDYQNRTPMVFVGANDGMLHGFNANTGEEMLAYVPGNKAVWSALPELSKPTYSHKYFVDASPGVGEFLNKSRKYRTLLASGMGAGGQGIFTLDITEGTFSESDTDARNTAIFEFTDENDPDVGYIFGTPQIVRMNNKQWAIIFGNGYNSTKRTYPSGAVDSNYSSTGKAALFILFIENGLNGEWVIDRDYIKIPVGNNNQNGLSQPFPVDIDGDFTVDYIYAGDLNGDLWKFNLTNTNSSQWNKAENISKLYSAGASQPIIQAPIVGAHPLGISKGLMVYFGTGKYIESSDTVKNNQSTQTFYGIWDKNSTPATALTNRTTLLQQEILSEVNNYRAVSNYQIDWNRHNGWYINLTQGEKTYSDPVLRNGRIIFSTVIPSASNAAISCTGDAATSWLMELDAANGGRLGISPFDINGDYYFDSNDYITFNETVNGQTVSKSAPPGGMKSPVGAMAAPTILTTQGGDKEVKILSGTNGMTSVTENPGPSTRGRQTWQEVN